VTNWPPLAVTAIGMWGLRQSVNWRTCLFVCLFVCLFFVCGIFCNGYLWCGLTQGDEVWQDGRPGWVAGALLFW